VPNKCLTNRQVSHSARPSVSPTRGLRGLPRYPLKAVILVCFGLLVAAGLRRADQELASMIGGDRLMLIIIQLIGLAAIIAFPGLVRGIL
jgi:hypothetical protein